MRIKWYGHACFLIETGGKKIVTDPFNQELGYPILPREADIITVSHDHWDHNAVEAVAGQPEIVRESGTHHYGDISISGMESFHDKAQGQIRGINHIYKINAEGINLVHLGDLGHVLTPQQLKEISPVDILLLPVGGTYTIDAGEAAELVKALQPSIVIPMHYATPCISIDIAPVEEFTSHYERVVKKPFLEVDRGSLGAATKIILLDYSG